MDGAETVRRIQKFARLRPDEQFVGVDINQIVQDAVAITRPRWEEKIARDSRPLELRLDLQAASPSQGRPAALTEVMTNLILNAIDAMPEGGTLTIATRTTPGRDVRVTVADTGIGMPEAVRQRIFEPFFSTKGEGGLGPRPVDGLLDRAAPRRRDPGGQRVRARGTTFTLVFPVATSRAAGRRRRADAPRAAGRRASCVVDNDAQVLVDPHRDAAQRRPHGDAGVERARRPSRPTQPGRFDVVAHQHRHGRDERLGGRRAAPRDRYARAAAVHHRLGTAGRGSRAPGALGVQRCLFKPVRPRRAGRAPCRRRWEPEPSGSGPLHRSATADLRRHRDLAALGATKASHLSNPPALVTSLNRVHSSANREAAGRRALVRSARSGAPRPWGGQRWVGGQIGPAERSRSGTAPPGVERSMSGPPPERFPEERHGSAGPLRTLGGLGGHIGAPHSTKRTS